MALEGGRSGLPLALTGGHRVEAGRLLLSSRFKPANVLTGARGRHCKAVFFFRSKLTLPEGEGPASRSKTLAEKGHRRAFTPAVILFIALPEDKDNIDPG